MEQRSQNLDPFLTTLPTNDLHQHPKLLVNAYPHDLEECLSEELVQFSALLRLQDDNFSSTDYKEINNQQVSSC